MRANPGILAALAWLLALPTVLAAVAHEHPYETDAERLPRLAPGGTCVIRGATVHTAVGPAFEGDVLVRDGDIAGVGASLDVPAGATEIDGRGKHLAPGVVDCHSHMAIAGGVNEGTVSISAEVRIADVVDADDIALYRALAGGATTARLLHGSANAIGGQDEVIKLRWKSSADGLRFPDAPRGIKFALGENPKRSNWGDSSSRFPNSRMGVEAIYYRAFERAREYAAAWERHEAAVAAGEDTAPPRRDIRLEALAAILDGDILVHSHCYRADEILMLIRASQHFGFQIATLQHVLEGYKVAYEMAEAGVGGSTFSDWWGYKIEAYDAIPHNAALMDEAGVLSSVNSDSDELVRHLYMEAAKSVRYAGMDPVRALALVTLNPARQLGIDARVGSIEQGKDADLVLLDGDPLSGYARVLWTMVDGRIEFERRDAFGLDADPPPVRTLETPADAAAGTGADTDADTGAEGTEGTEQGADPTAVDEGEGETVALVGGTLHTVLGAAIENGTLLMRGGRIVALGDDVPVPAGARVIDVAGRHVHPGFIALDTALGLREISSISATMDAAEIGGDHPDLRVAASINADSAHIAVTRANGVTRAQAAPRGGGPLLGQSAVLRLAGDTWEDLVAVDRDMLHVTFPRLGNDADPKRREEVRERVRDLERAFDDARAYAAAAGVTPRAFDPRLAALAPYARGEARVALHANNAQTILWALRFAKEQELDAVLFGVREGWKVVDALASSGLPVVVGGVLELPSGAFDPYDAPYANAAVLARAGVPIAIASGDDQNPRNVVFHAATAAAFGLPRAEALRAITFDAARVLGLEAELGHLSIGAVADVVVSSGDPLETTSSVDYVFIDGVQQTLANRQTRLYERYRERLHRLQGR